jgi:hypothetical protein
VLSPTCGTGRLAWTVLDGAHPMTAACHSSQNGSRSESTAAGLIARGLPDRRIVIVGNDPNVRWAVEDAARELRAEVRALRRPEDLEGWLRTSTVDLVVVCGAAAAQPASTLAAVRNHRCPTSCLVVSFVHPCLAQVTVSDSAGRPSSTKVVDREVLGHLPARLLAGEDPWQRVD